MVSVVVSISVFQTDDGGANPTTTHMNEVKTYRVEAIPKEHTYDWLLNKHYAKRIPPIMESFGLYDKDRKLQGVCTFGMPTRMFNNGEAVFGKQLKVQTLELNRLCVNDGLGKNVLSFFVSKCLMLMPKPLCVVSYADSNAGHHGYIYQATNWIFTGKTEPRSKFVDVNGKDVHERTIWSRYGSEEKALKSGEIKKTQQEGKYRYFQFLGTKDEVKQMKDLLVYPKQPYPKGVNGRYDASYKPTVNATLF